MAPMPEPNVVIEKRVTCVRVGGVLRVVHTTRKFRGHYEATCWIYGAEQVATGPTAYIAECMVLSRANLDDDKPRSDSGRLLSTGNFWRSFDTWASERIRYAPSRQKHPGILRRLWRRLTGGRY